MDWLRASLNLVFITSDRVIKTTLLRTTCNALQLGGNSPIMPGHYVSLNSCLSYKGATGADMDTWVVVKWDDSAYVIGNKIEVRNFRPCENHVA